MSRSCSASGIDIYTTLNIQHIESLNDVVAQITGMTVHETIPDRVIDEATDIELVDLPPEELLNRLKEGKVYIPEQAQRAVQNFFRQGNLTALRELTMRRAAERVDDQMRAYMQTRAIPGPWPAGERLLVCISPGALGERLIRTARRLADELNAEWFAIYVETPDQAGISQEQRDQVAQSLRLAEELGAKSVSLPGQSVAETVMDYARRHNVTKVIAGKPLQARWIEALRGSTVDQLIRLSGSIDVYVINSEAEPSARKAVEAWRPHRPLIRYFWALMLVAAATGLGALLAPHISPTNLIVIYLLAGRGRRVLPGARACHPDLAPERGGLRFLLCAPASDLCCLRYRIPADLPGPAGGRPGGQPADRPGARPGRGRPTPGKSDGCPI